MWNIVVGLIMLVGGLSGRLSLIGTDSSKALAVIGGAVLCWGLYQEWKRRKGPGE